MVWATYIYIFCQNFDFNRPVGYNIIWSLAIMLFWSLVELPDVPLMHYGKWEIIELISSMEPEFKLILRWTKPLPAEAPGASSQWGHSITVAGNPKRITGSKRKSFMADMYGFSTDGELSAVCNYLRTHGGYKIGTGIIIFVQRKGPICRVSWLIVIGQATGCLLLMWVAWPIICWLLTLMSMLSSVLLSRPFHSY